MLSSSTVCSRSELVSCGKSQSKDIYVLIFYVNPWNFSQDLQSHESLCFLLLKTHVMRVLWSAHLGRSQKTDENWGDILGTGEISKWISEQHLSSVFSFTQTERCLVVFWEKLARSERIMRHWWEKEKAWERGFVVLTLLSKSL